MSANGRAATILSRVAKKWNGVLAALSTVEEPPKKRAPSPTEIRDLALQQWARTAPPELFDWLDELIAYAAQEAREAVESHGRLARATGAGDALSIIKTQFKAWIGTSHNALES